MNYFDVVVIGAGPAGGQMARVMSKSGYRVLLVEQQEDFSKNDFSSAVTPLDTLKRFDLPETIVGSFWHKFAVVTTNIERSWDAPKPLGAVLDFAKLKKFLAHEVKASGSKVWMGYRYISHVQDRGKTVVTLKQRSTGILETIATQVLVDATGFSRSVMYKKKSEQPRLLSATGIEYVIKVDREVYQKYENSIYFFLGFKWMPKGYAWIFPMKQCWLKVGAGRFNLEHETVKHTESIQYYIQLLIDQHIMPKQYEIIDTHGSTIKYSQGLQDVYCKENTIAIGDAVSTINFLGGEGIRHGMFSAELAAIYVKQYLEHQISDFQAYQAQMRQHFLPIWDISAKAGVKKYLMDSDRKIDESFTYLGYLTTQEIMDILFYYKFEKLNRGLVKYLLTKLSLLITGFGRFLKFSSAKY